MADASKGARLHWAAWPAALSLLLLAVWGLVSKADLKEALSGVSPLVWIIAGCGLAGTAALFAMLYRQRFHAMRELACKDREYRRLLDVSRDVIIIATPDGTVLEASRAAEQMYGRSREEMIGMHPSLFRAPEARDSIQANIELVRSKGHAIYETLHVRSDGTRVPVEVSVSWDKSGETPLLVGIVRDISDRKREEARLLQANRLLKTLSEVNQLIVRERDRDALLQGVCRVLVEHGGFTRAWIAFREEEGSPFFPVAMWASGERECAPIGGEETQGPAKDPKGAVAAPRPCPCPVPKEMAPPFEWEEKAKERGCLAFGSFVFQAPPAAEGALCICAPHGLVISDEEGRLLKELAGDIAFALEAQEERRRREEAQEARHQARERLQNLLALTPSVIYSLLPSGSSPEEGFRMGFMSASVEALFGFAPEECLAPGWWEENLHPEDREGAIGRLESVWDRGALDHEYRFRTKGGRYRWVHDRLRIVLGQHGGPKEVIGSWMDITRIKEMEADLAQSRDHYLTILEEFPAMIWRSGPDGACDYYNKTWLEFRGRTLEEELREGWEGGVHPADREERITSYREAFDAREPLEMQYRLLRRDGEYRWLQDQGRPMFDLRGNFTGYLGSAYDITSRFLAAQALTESEELFRGVFEMSPLGMVIATMEGVIERVNGAFCSMLGYTEEELEGKTIEEITHREDWPATARAILDLESGEAPFYTIEKRYIKKGGESLWASVSSTAVRDAAGSPISLIGQVQDITESRRAEEQLKSSESIFRSFFENNPAATYLATTSGEVLLANAPFRDLFGGQAGWQNDLVGEGRMFKDDKEWGARLRELASFKLSPLREVAFALEDGGDVCCLETSSGVFAETGEITGVIGFLLDQTSRRELEVQLFQAQKMEAIGQLAGGIAHDFNNLLQAIRGSAEMLLAKAPPSAGERRELDTIHGGCVRAAELTRQLLAFARRQVIQPVLLDLNSVLGGIERVLKRLLPETIRVQVMPGDGVPPVRADKTQVEQVLLNLCINAKDAMAGGGTLRLKTRSILLGEDYAKSHPWAHEGRYALLEVEDEGQGIAAENLPHIFEPFFTTKEQGKGTGMGLATTYGIVKQHGGMIDVSSEVGEGTTFQIHFPAAEGEVEAPQPEKSASHAPGGTEKILVVEDDPDVRAVVADALKNLGYEVITCSDGREALDLLRGGAHADVVLSDVVMPGMGGAELAKEVRAFRPLLPFIFVSGYADTAFSREFLEQEGVHFLSKPFGMAALAQKVREALPHRAAHAQESAKKLSE